MIGLNRSHTVTGVVEKVYPTRFKVKYEDGEVGFVGRDTTEGVRILN